MGPQNSSFLKDAKSKNGLIDRSIAVYFGINDGGSTEEGCAIASRDDTTIYALNVVSTRLQFRLSNLPWPGDSERTFRSSSQTVTCPPVFRTR